MEKVYSFTNENVASFNTIYDFSNSKVLSVLGSGDQYFSGLLFGASEIDLYDINPLTWDFFILKYYGIIILSYEEFYDYFVVRKLDDYNYFRRLKCYMPYDVAERLDTLYKKYGKLSHFVDYIDSANINFDDGRIIPYLNKNEYNRLKIILSNKNLPFFYQSSLATLPDKLSGKYYDILIASNIFYWLYLSENAETEKVYEYKELLNRFNCSEIQAIYCWWLNEVFQKELIKNSFQIVEVPTAKKLKLTNDYVVSYKKKKL